MTKRHYLLVFLAFFCAVTLTAIVGAVQPKVLTSFRQLLGDQWSHNPVDNTTVSNVDVLFSSRICLLLHWPFFVVVYLDECWPFISVELWSSILSIGFFYFLLFFIINILKLSVVGVDLSRRRERDQWTAALAEPEKTQENKTVTITKLVCSSKLDYGVWIQDIEFRIWHDLCTSSYF